MKCPTCAIDLVMSERSGIEIDYCPTCRGVWLDRGELDKIIARAGEQTDVRPQPVVAAPQPPPYQQPQAHYPQQEQHYNRGHGHQQGHGYQQGHGQKPYRKKSFLEELFD